MKKIMILNGSGRPNGSTSGLVKAFTEGAKSAGHEVREFFIQKMNIRGCINCQGCSRANADPNYPCVQKDDMASIYEAFAWCDIIVFASPIYWFTINGTLKVVIDRLYAMYRKHGMEGMSRQTVLLMTSGSPMYEEALTWYANFEKYLHWDNLGSILGADKKEDAQWLGASLENLSEPLSLDDIR